MTTLSIIFSLLLVASLALLLIPLLKQTKEARSQNTKRSMVAIAFFIPIFTMGLYFTLGKPWFAETATQQEKPQIETLVEKLEKKLAHTPKDLDGWLLLGRSYMITEQYNRAIFAFEKAVILEPYEMGAILPLADALAMTQEGSLMGRPYQLLTTAIDLEPENTMALWLMGMAEHQLNQTELAAKNWTKLHGLLPAHSKQQKRVEKMLKAIKYPVPAVIELTPVEAKKVALQTPSVPQTDDKTAHQAFKINLMISKEDKTYFAGSTVFVYAKSPTGMPMPIAAQKLNSSVLGSSVTLSAKDELMPSRKLKDFNTLVVGIKITKANEAVTAAPIYKSEVTVSNYESISFVITR